ncbi:Uncharacterised protein [Mycobacteroides abscessus subsp. abscessus]|nr:Uncharacterised protein [Mycobacteroides abscessus subsp. abscessus]
MSIGPTLGADRAVRNRAHGDAARRDLAVELDEIVGDERVGRRTLERRTFDESVAQRQRPKACRLEGVGGRRRAVHELTAAGLVTVAGVHG